MIPWALTVWPPSCYLWPTVIQVMLGILLQTTPQKLLPLAICAWPKNAYIILQNSVRSANKLACYISFVACGSFHEELYRSSGAQLWDYSCFKNLENTWKFPGISASFVKIEDGSLGWMGGQATGQGELGFWDFSGCCHTSSAMFCPHPITCDPFPLPCFTRSPLGTQLTLSITW